MPQKVNVKKLSAPVKTSTGRVSTGIPGLDELLEGGYVKGSTILVTGGTGTGKTTFCAQFIREGLKKGEPGVYITMEEDPEDIKEDLKRFGFNFERFEKSKVFSFVYQNPFEISDISSTIVDAINSVNAQRVVIDPVSLIGMYMKDPAVLRKRLFEIIRLLKKTGATTLITSEILDNEIGERSGGSLSREGVTEFIVDSVLVLNLFGVGGGITRSILIRKMRRTKHGTDVYPMEITSKGIAVKKE
ncbi:MAG: AAA family ATPase [Candidatus Aenigmarchaeota archaeon]|nr:AAA family ATPase [Candidatus Aenigmarchaeota archaeon]